MKNNTQLTLWKLEQRLSTYKLEKSCYSVSSLPMAELFREAIIINEAVGNNSFQYETGRELTINPVSELVTENFTLATNPVFFSCDDNNSYSGLATQLSGYTQQSGVPCYICDNHNLVLEAWQLAYKYFGKCHLIHIDQHRDNALAEYDDQDFLVTSKICDYIDFAVKYGWIDHDYSSIIEPRDLDNLQPVSTPKIVNIDLDIFAAEVTIFSIEEKIEIILQAVQEADLITIATSPGFIPQDEALTIAKLLYQYL